MALSFEQEFDIADCGGRTLQLPVEVTLDDRTQRKERSTTMSHLKRSFANESFVTIRAEIAPRIARVQQVKEHYDITQRGPADERERDRDAKIMIVRSRLKLDFRKKETINSTGDSVANLATVR